MGKKCYLCRKALPVTMKNLSCLALALLAVSACTALEEPLKPEEPGKETIVFTVSREGTAPLTRTQVQEDGSVWWNPYEQVSVFYGSGNSGGSCFVTTNGAPAAQTELSGSIQMSGTGKAFWAVYPYAGTNACDGSSVTMSIPSLQQGVGGNFSNNAFPAIATSNSLDLAFWNVCGGVKFSVSRGDITSVSFRGNKGEPLAGKVSVGFGTDGRPVLNEVLEGCPEVTLIAPGYFEPGVNYYITLLPAVLEGGFTMTLRTADGRGRVVSNSPRTVKRSVFGVLNGIDEKVAEWESLVPEAVDLGLSVQWASFNVGAFAPEEYGDYFAWGETSPKAEYSWETYKWCNGSEYSLTRYNYDGNYGETDYCSMLNAYNYEDDAARANWQGNWRIPTEEEWNEICNYNNCSWEWQENYNGSGVNGYLVSSLKQGYTDRSIFLPAAGYRIDQWVSLDGRMGHYWSSIIDNNNPAVGKYLGYSGSFVGATFPSSGFPRFAGFPVRPVDDTPNYYYSVGALQDVYNSNNELAPGVKKHPITITDKNGTEWAYLELLLANGDTDYQGSYPSTEYATQPGQMANGWEFDLSEWGIGILSGGSYCINNNGEKILLGIDYTVNVYGVDEGIYRFTCDNLFSFTAARKDNPPVNSDEFVLQITSGLTYTMQDLTASYVDSNNNPLSGVTLWDVTVNEYGALVAHFDLLVAEGSSDITGSYNVIPYPDEVGEAGVGWGIAAWSLFGGCYYKVDGANYYIPEGTSVTVSANGDGTLKFQFQGNVQNENNAIIGTGGLLLDNVAKE